MALVWPGQLVLQGLLHGVRAGLPGRLWKSVRWRLKPLAGATCLLSSTSVLLWLGHLGGGVGAQAQFGRSRSWPWVPVWRDLTGLGGYQVGSITSVLAIALGAAYVCARRESVAWRVAVAVTLLMHLVMARQFPAYTINAARYLLPMYPVWVWCARKTTRIQGPVLVGASSMWCRLPCSALTAPVKGPSTSAERVAGVVPWRQWSVVALDTPRQSPRPAISAALFRPFHPSLGDSPPKCCGLNTTNSAPEWKPHCTPCGASGRNKSAVRQGVRHAALARRS